MLDINMGGIYRVACTIIHIFSESKGRNKMAWQGNGESEVRSRPATQRTKKSKESPR
ncbi:MAG: hypothetical protein LH479_14220 [Polaromonas sp.]|nr:hypothetical protein [Polaromonas sp.]